MTKVLVVLMGVTLAGVASGPHAAVIPTVQQLALETEATELIERVEEVAQDVRFHASRLEALALNTSVSDESHYHHLELIRDEVNGRLSPALKRLAELGKLMPEWKQVSIDRMTTDAQRLAADTSHALFSIRRDPRRPLSRNDGYRQVVRDVLVHSTSLVTSATVAHSYAVGHRKALEAGLPVKR